MKRVIVNGFTGSSWQFKRFERLSVVGTTADTNFSLAQHKKIEFIQFEAGKLDQNPHEYDEEKLDFLAENDDFIDNESLQEQSEEPKSQRFVNQTRELNEALNYDDGSRLDRCDLQP